MIKCPQCHKEAGSEYHPYGDVYTYYCKTKTCDNHLKKVIGGSAGAARGFAGGGAAAAAPKRLHSATVDPRQMAFLHKKEKEKVLAVEAEAQASIAACEQKVAQLESSLTAVNAQNDALREQNVLSERALRERIRKSQAEAKPASEWNVAREQVLQERIRSSKAETMAALMMASKTGTLEERAREITEKLAKDIEPLIAVEAALRDSIDSMRAELVSLGVDIKAARDKSIAKSPAGGSTSLRPQSRTFSFRR